MAEPLPIDERIETAGHLVVRARIFYDVWWLYEGAETRPQIIDSMNKFPEFFRYDSHAHFVAFVVHIAGLFESREDTINLPMLVSELAVSGVSVTEAESLISEAHPFISKVMILRSNLFAHRSAALTYEKAFEKANITANQLGHLCELALRIINCLLLARGLEEKLFHELSRCHANAMLNALGKTSAT